MKSERMSLRKTRWTMLVALFIVHSCIPMLANALYVADNDAAEVCKPHPFFNLTASEVRIDSVLPVFHYSYPLGPHYADSLYEVSIDYPEFIDMSASDVARYQSLTTQPLPFIPKIEQYVGVARKEGTLYVSFIPLVFRDGKYQKLVSFSLSVKAFPVANARRASEAPGRYADHSVLATGTWAKIRVPETGIYQLTDAVVRQAGFSNPSKVRIFGYGGALQPERLTANYLLQTDDLKEVPSCMVGDRRLFYAVGPVNWASASNPTRQRNPYSDYGYYFLTDGDETPLMVDSETFMAGYPTANDYHSHHEIDDYAWFHGGRNLYERAALVVSQPSVYTLPAYSKSGQLVVTMSYNGACEATVALNDSVVGQIFTGSGSGKASVDKYSVAAADQWTFNLSDCLLASNKIAITQKSGTDMRLDYMTIISTEAKPVVLSASFPAPEYVYRITNQDHHADPQADMVIIIPTTQKFLSEAQRLKTLHEQNDQMRVNIVPADELFNEFSSGTPDANAYRRYLKMLYDRAETSADQPRYLLLFGDGAWDNRMLSSDWQLCSPDDFLLCYESENSFSETDCYVSDDYYGLLDDDEGGNMLSDKIDVAVGRLPARSLEEARILVDKIEAYCSNVNAGAWQNALCFMGDDGDANLHMNDAEAVVATVKNNYSAYQIKKIYWDAYTRISSSTGLTYPDVTQLIKQQMRNGALIMNYSGHGAAYCLSHEQVIRLTDFKETTSSRLPLWVTASCDIMPFDGQEENIGETTMLNERGGSIAFYGTTRTVYASYNRPMNQKFMTYVLGTTDGVRNSIGEAARLSKNAFTAESVKMLVNKQQFTLLGDPALVLAAPTLSVSIDSVNGQAVGNGICRLKAGSSARISGHVVGQESFRGVATIMVFDVEETIVGHKYDENADKPIEFKDRPSIIYSSSDSVVGGYFSFTFMVPKDISYSDDTGMIQVYAVNNDRTLEAHGQFDDFVLTGNDDLANDGVGPSIYCYLNSEQFVNGGTVNATPYFVAQLIDKDGINVAGNGIGHDLELTIDGDMARTYNLNNYFQYDFGEYRSGVAGFSIPALDNGQHRLVFKAWDMLNNSSTAELTFTVDAKQQPTIMDIVCTRNPATTSTQFVITHDRTGSQMDVILEVYDTSGRKLWVHDESGVPTDQTYVVDWDLTIGSGSRLHTGVYLYRMLISSNGSTKASKAKKLIVLGNN